jgi:hypothetical protein
VSVLPVTIARHAGTQLFVNVAFTYLVGFCITSPKYRLT